MNLFADEFSNSQLYSKLSQSCAQDDCDLKAGMATVLCAVSSCVWNAFAWASMRSFVIATLMEAVSMCERLTNPSLMYTNHCSQKQVVFKWVKRERGRKRRICQRAKCIIGLFCLGFD